MEDENDSFVLGNYTLDPKGTDFIGKASRVSDKANLVMVCCDTEK